MMKKIWVIVFVSLSALSIWLGFIKQTAIKVDVFEVAGKSFEIKIREEAYSRFFEPYNLYSPHTGQISRLLLQEGSKVKRGDILYQLSPLASRLLTGREREQAQAAVQLSQAGVELSQNQLAASKIEWAHQQKSVVRYRDLFSQGALSAESLDQAELKLAVLEELVKQSQLRLEQAESSLWFDQAVLTQTKQNGELKAFSIYAPIEGVISRLHRKSAGPVQLGERLVQIANPNELEVVSEMLTEQAVSIKPGMDARLTQWGGPELDAVISRIEPSGFTKISALGVEEQRVKVIVTTDSELQAKGVGDHYRFQLEVILQRIEADLVVPRTSIYSQKGASLVLVVNQDRFEEHKVKIGSKNQKWAEIKSGLAAGAVVVRFPAKHMQVGQKAIPIGSIEPRD